VEQHHGETFVRTTEMIVEKENWDDAINIKKFGAARATRAPIRDLNFAREDAASKTQTYLLIDLFFVVEPVYACCLFKMNKYLHIFECICDSEIESFSAVQCRDKEWA